MIELGRIGAWSSLRTWDRSAIGDAATLLEALGYSALWMPGGAGGDILERCRYALEATGQLHVASGIVNVWRHDPAEVARETAMLRAVSGDRFVLGLGAGHARSIGEEYAAPFTKMRGYLDALDAEGQEPGVRVLAALRPRMLGLAADRSAGAHPYFVPPEHTAAARALLGAGPLLAPEQTVALARDPSEARAVGREFCSRYLGLPNYTNNLRQLGFTDADLVEPGSDRLVDAIVAWGDVDAIAARVHAHLDAGADHVCIQVVGRDSADGEAEAWRELAPALLR